MLRHQSRRVLEALVGVCLVAGCSASNTPQSKSTGAFALQLSPAPVTATTSVTAVLGDPLPATATCSFEWRRNGVVIPGASTEVLAPSSFSKGDEVAVTVSISDPAGAPARTAMATARVVNSPPVVTRVTLAINATPGGAEIQANAESTDPDGDQPTLVYKWFQNGHAIEDATGPALPASRVPRGEQVTVEVVASDPETSSPPQRSAPFAVDNRPPQFSSQPAPPKASDTEFVYRPVASDPDGDPLRYQLVSGPLGMSIDAQGMVHWSLPPPESRAGEYAVKIQAADPNGGEAVQEFTLRLEARKPRP